MGATLVGTGVGWSYIRWGAIYTSLEIRRAVHVICLSVALAGVAKVALGALPFSFILGAMLVLATANLASLRILLGHANVWSAASQACAGPNPQPAERSRCVHELWPFAIALGALCAALGCLYSMAPNTQESREASRLWGYLLEIAGALAVFWWVCVLKKSVSVTGITAALAVVVAAGIWVLSLVGPVGNSIFFQVTNVDHSLLTLFLWIVLVDVAQWHEGDPYEVFATGWVLRSAPFWAATVPVILQKSTLTAASYTTLLFSILIVLVLVLMGQRAGGRLLASLRGVSKSDASTLEARCALIARNYGLTPREQEVLAMLCRGRSRPYIAETLYLSENTVRSYTKNLYRKLDVHNRQSLLQLVDDYTPDSGVPVAGQSHPAGY